MPGEIQTTSAFEKQQKQLESVIGEKQLTKTKVDEIHQKALNNTEKIIENFSTEITQEEKQILLEGVKNRSDQNFKKLEYELNFIKEETRIEYIETRSQILPRAQLLKHNLEKSIQNSLDTTDTNEEENIRAISDHEFAKILENLSRSKYIEVIKQESLRDINFEKKGKAKTGEIFQILDEEIYYKTWGKKQYEYRKVIDTKGNEFFICTSDGNVEIKNSKIEYVQVAPNTYIHKGEIRKGTKLYSYKNKKLNWAGIAQAGLLEKIGKPIKIKGEPYQKIVSRENKILFIPLGEKAQAKGLEESNKNNLATKLDIFTLVNRDAKKDCMSYAQNISENILEGTEIQKKYSSYLTLSRKSNLRKISPFYIKQTTEIETDKGIKTKTKFEASFQGFVTLDHWVKEYNKDTKKNLSWNDLETSLKNKEKIEKFIQWFKKTEELKKAGNLSSIGNRKHVEPFRAYEEKLDPKSEKSEERVSAIYEKIIKNLKEDSNTPMLLSLERIFQKKGKNEPGSHGGFLIEENGEYFLYHSSTKYSSRKSPLKNYLNSYFQKGVIFSKKVYLSVMLMDSKGEIINLRK